MNATAQYRLSLPSEEQMHASIIARDAAGDGKFWYGVVTTGIYCRPSCGARPAKRENLRFFAAPEDAERAGFRACKRCRPNDARRDVDTLIRVARYIEKHADEPLTLAVLSEKAGLSPARLQKKFKAAFGVSPKDYRDAMRLGRFKGALKKGDSVTDAIYAAGFGSASRVYGEASRNIGMTPAAYRAGGEGERIFHAYRSTALGPLLMAATSRGVCFAQFGDGRNALLEQLRREFPGAELIDSPAAEAPALDAWIAALDEHLGKNAPRPDVPLDLCGTSFQLRVWRFLLSVNEGDAVSYGEVARGIGQPKAVRAVASACAANRVSVLVPCHRVLRGDGALGGYRWGVERKRALLDNERARRATE